jgi:hypothetical protein
MDAWQLHGVDRKAKALGRGRWSTSWTRYSPATSTGGKTPPQLPVHTSDGATRRRLKERGGFQPYGGTRARGIRRQQLRLGRDGLAAFVAVLSHQIQPTGCAAMTSTKANRSPIRGQDAIVGGVFALAAIAWVRQRSADGRHATARRVAHVPLRAKPARGRPKPRNQQGFSSNSWLTPPDHPRDAADERSKR